MKAFIRFWKTDWTNKLIVLISLGLIAAAAALAYLVIAMPQGKSLRGAVSDALPWIATPTPLRQARVPTMTPAPSAAPEEIPLTPGSLPVLGISAAAPQDAATEVPEATPTSTPEPLDPLACLKELAQQEGIVLEVLDGYTLRVLINGLVYPVRYTGVEVPTEGRQAEASWEKNTELVYGKKVKLYTDVSDKDPRGRLLRYVLEGDTFANLEMIRTGWGKPLAMPPDSSCDKVFAEAERGAKQAGLGIWLPRSTQTPNPQQDSGSD